MKYFMAVMSLSLCLAFSSLVFAEGDIAAGKVKSATCVACHSVDGNSVVAIWPKIAGQKASYLVQQLKYFRSGKRKNASMNPLVANLSDADIENLAAYYASMKISPNVAKKELVQLGRQIYRAGDKENKIPACTACHGPDGIGNSAAKFPALAGQHAAYTETQLKAYRSKQRMIKEPYIMASIAKHMSDEQINAVASYIAGLH